MIMSAIARRHRLFRLPSTRPVLLHDRRPPQLHSERHDRTVRGSEIEFVKAYGLAHRAHQIANTADTRFAIASGSKGLTALTVVSLINDNALSMSTTARSVLGRDLPLIGGDVTIEQLLAHRSGIGDYLDEAAGDDVTDYLLTVPPQDLATTEG